MSLPVRSILAAGLALAMALAARAQLTNFTIIDYPGNPLNRSQIFAMNDAGVMVGAYPTPTGRHGYVYRDGQFTTITYPGAPITVAVGLNNAGEIAGSYQDASAKWHGFTLIGGRFTQLDYPGSELTQIFKINARSEMVGRFDKDGRTFGFLLAAGRYTSIEYPGATFTVASGINDLGDVIGYWDDAEKKRRGFLLSQGKFTLIEFPGAQSTLFEAGGINNAGDIVGPYLDARGKRKGFLLQGGRYTNVEVAGSNNTSLHHILASGQIGGWYQDSGGVHGILTTLAPPATTQPMMVDDDGADCPGAVSTIQEAVRRATPGATILVCRGLYTGAVNITGPEKNGLKLITTGRTHDVVLQGDYLARDGFHLENVSNILIRGFTVRDFGNKATTDKEWGAGHLVYLENAHYNTIEQNHFFNSDRAAVMLVDSAHNVVQQNVATADNGNLATTGIEAQGAKSANNVIRLNMTYNNKLGGINLENLVKATVFDNRARNNTGADLNWDGKGDNRLEANACDTCLPASACGK
jgi:parallel beta-helix repeat protein